MMPDPSMGGGGGDGGGGGGVGVDLVGDIVEEDEEEGNETETIEMGGLPEGEQFIMAKQHAGLWRSCVYYDEQPGE